MVRLPGNLGRGTVAERNRLLEQRQRACRMADQEALEARKREAEAKARKSAAEAKVEAARKVVEAGLEAERLAIECASDMKSAPSSISSFIASNGDGLGASEGDKLGNKLGVSDGDELGVSDGELSINSCDLLSYRLGTHEVSMFIPNTDPKSASRPCWHKVMTLNGVKVK